MHKMKFLLVSGILMMLVAACNQSTKSNDSNPSSTGETATTTDPLEPVSLNLADNGGYDVEDEAPAFGLPSMEQFGNDTAHADPTVTDTEETAEGETPGAQVYYLRVVWGNLALDGFAGEDRADVPPDWLDWSGTLTLSGKGVLILKRTILFDRHDRIVPEDDPRLVQWRSHTGPHIDGYLVKVIYHPDPETTDAKITFATDLLTQEISIADLDHFNEIVTIDAEGHGVAFTGIRVDDDTCPEGFLQGKYHHRPEGEGGIFRGRFLADSGRLNGHLRGHYGLNEEGEQVIFGKYITLGGHFQGLLHGHYTDGAFDGDWTDAAHALEGTLHGKYVTGETVDSGFFQGFWEKTCE